MTVFLALFVCLLLPVFAAAQDGGGTRSPFELGGSARASGMGGAMSGITDGGDGFFWNPAVLANLQKNEIFTFHAPLFLDTLYDSVAYIHPLGPGGSFGGALARVGTSDIFQTSGNVQPISTITFEQFQGLIGFGFQCFDGLDVGANVKYLRQEAPGLQGNGIGVDVGLLFRLGRQKEDYAKIGLNNLTVALSVSNLLRPQPKLIQTGDNPDRIVRAGLSYLYRFPSTEDQIWLDLEVECPWNGGVTLIKGGMEYGWNNLLYGRAGFDGMAPTVGAGIKYIGLEFDYAFNQRDLGSLHRFSLTYRFGGYKDPLQAKRIELLKWVARSFSKSGDYGPAIQSWENVLKEFPGDEEARKSIQDLKDQRNQLVAEQLKQAKEAVKKGDVERALPILGKLIALDPGNPEVKALLGQVDKRLLVSTHYVAGVEAYGKEDYEKAAENLGMVYEVEPGYRDVNFLFHDAQSHVQPLQSMPKETTELYAKGVELYMNGHYGKAVEVWQKVLAKDPKNFLVRRNIEEALNRAKTAPGASQAPSKDGQP